MEFWRRGVDEWRRRSRLINDIEKKITKINKIDVSTFIPLSIRIIRLMNEEEIHMFIIKISFIEKWTEMFEQSESTSLTKVLDFFFTTNTDFHIVFSINIEFYIYNSHLDTILIATIND